MAIDELKLREELEVFLRNSDVMSVAKREVTTYVEVFTASAGQLVFTVAQPGIKNVRSVKNNASALKYGTQYTSDYHSGKVTLAAACSGGEAIEIKFDAGVGDHIFSDLPRIDLSLESYPRIGFDDISHASVEQCLGGTLVKTDILVSLVCYATTKEECLTMWQACRNAVLANKKNFYHISFITLAGAGPLAKSAGRHEKVMQKNQDFRIPFEFEAT